MPHPNTNVSSYPPRQAVLLDAALPYTPTEPLTGLSLGVVGTITVTMLGEPGVPVVIPSGSLGIGIIHRLQIESITAATATGLVGYR